MGILSHEEKLAIARFSDLEAMCEKKKSPQFSLFLHPKEIMLFKNAYRPSHNVNTMLFGGYDEAERCMLGFFPLFWEPDKSDFPLSSIKITGAEDKTHRDFLGSVLALGIKREVIGDITIGDEAGYIFVADSICDYICLNLKKIGRQNIVAQEILPTEAKIAGREFDENVAVISSLRLDAIVSQYTKLSRKNVVEAIEKEKVTINWQTAYDPDKKVKEGDVISVRGYGRVRLGEILGETKKGRIRVMLYSDK